jgi:RNA polymerase sigma-70 factor (ECF subfamily)
MTALASVTAETDGPEAGLALLDRLGDDANRFQPAWATRANLLARLGRTTEAADAYDRAIALTTDPAARAHLERERVRALVSRPTR